MTKKNKSNNSNPTEQEIRNLLYQYQTEQLDFAEKIALIMTDKYSKNPLAWKVLSAILIKTGRHRQAYEVSKKTLKLSPQDAEVHNNIGVILKSMGNIHESEKHYKRAIQLKPDFAEAYRNLANIKKFFLKDEEFLKMSKLCTDKKISNEQLCHIHFGLAKANDDMGDYKQAFYHYNHGNMLRKKILKYDFKQDAEIFNKIKFNYQKIASISLNFEKLINNKTPIFIVGMPRSGTTLVEQIISSHSKVSAGGELPFVQQLGFELSIGKLEITPYILGNFRASYLDKLEKISEGKDLITDKMPNNFLHIGLIAAAFPEAKIINVLRDPPAVCWSNFVRYFSSRGMSFSFDLKDSISYYQHYIEHINFWRKHLSNKIYNVNYEKLVTDQEKETRNLIEYINLGWEDNLLYPEKNNRAVSTASNIQVKKSIYQGSSQQWKNYKEFLNDTFDVFKD
ncbi:sulfotransferase [Candidatus Pelagibacter sp.]|nr:sulfotransferase [Candidatus Pelagibacter sp.]